MQGLNHHQQPLCEPAFGPSQLSLNQPGASIAINTERGRMPVARLIKIDEVLARYPVSRSQLYSLIAAGRFPKQVHAGGGQSAFWVESEVEAWIQAQVEGERRANVRTSPQ